MSWVVSSIKPLKPVEMQLLSILPLVTVFIRGLVQACRGKLYNPTDQIGGNNSVRFQVATALTVDASNQLYSLILFNVSFILYPTFANAD